MTQIGTWYNTHENEPAEFQWVLVDDPTIQGPVRCYWKNEGGYKVWYFNGGHLSGPPAKWMIEPVKNTATCQLPVQGYEAKLWKSFDNEKPPVGEEVWGFDEMSRRVVRAKRQSEKSRKITSRNSKSVINKWQHVIIPTPPRD